MLRRLGQLCTPAVVYCELYNIQNKTVFVYKGNLLVIRYLVHIGMEVEWKWQLLENTHSL